MQKKWILKTTLFVSCLIVLMLAAVACSKEDKSVTESASPKSPADNGKPPVVTALMLAQTNFPADNPVIQAIRKESGINLQVESVADADYDKRMNTALVSGTAPDILVVSKSKLRELADNKVIMPLDDLIKQHGPNITENKGADLKGPAYINSHVYGIPSASPGGVALAIRKDWLDKLNLPVPTTTDQFETVLKAFANNDPDGNGKKDTVGLGLTIVVDQNWHAIFGAFNVPVGQAKMVDGKVTPWMLVPKYLDAVKYLNKLYHEGLLEPDFATINHVQTAQKLWDGKIGAYTLNADAITTAWLTRYVEKPAPTFVYTVLKGPDGQGGYPKQVSADASSYAVINSKAKDPVAALKLIDFLVGKKGDALTWSGIEGTSYKYVDGKFQWIPPYDDAVKLRDFGGYMYSSLLHRTNGMREELFNDITRQGRKLMEANQIDSAYIFGIPQVQVEKGTILNDMEREFRTKAIIADSGAVDQLYADFKKNYLSGGGNEWIEQATKIYNDEVAARK
jgi:putative aldouronate transport system substrate-binding protein